MNPEDIIKSIPEDDEYDDKHCGTINIKFMRLIPSFKIIDKKIPMSLFFQSLSKIKEEYKENGIAVSINSGCLKISDYYKFVKTLLKNQRVEVIDRQRSGEGEPDFKINQENGEDFFHIEYKSPNDSIRPNQLQWLGDNLSKEVWFLMMEEIETLIESSEINNRQQHLFMQRQEIINNISSQVCRQIDDKLQNKETKITSNE